MKSLYMLVFLCIYSICFSITFVNKSKHSAQGLSSKENHLLLGETQDNAIKIHSFPFQNVNNNSGYIKDYNILNLTGSSPDVVYKFNSNQNWYNVNITLCSSLFDTKVAVFKNSIQAQNLIAYNDDFCNVQSGITGLSFYAGNIYYILVTGYQNCSGEYTLNIEASTQRNTNLPYTQNFNNSYFPPFNWQSKKGEIQPLTELSYWQGDNFANNSNSTISAKINLYQTDNDWLISPEFYFEDNQTYVLSYNIALTKCMQTQASNIGIHDTLYVKIISSNDDINYSMQELKQYNSQTNISSFGMQEKIIIQNQSGYKKIAFFAKGKDRENDVEIFIDDFSLKALDEQNSLHANVTSLDFGHVYKNFTASKQIILQNVSSYDVIINTPPEILNSYNFCIVDDSYNYPITISAQSTVSYAIAFKPQILQEESNGTFKLEEENNLVTVSLSGICGIVPASAIYADEGITSIFFANIRNSSMLGNKGYQDFTNIETDVVKWQSYYLCGTFFPYYINNKIGIWIDWNHNGDFSDDNSELFIEDFIDGNFYKKIYVPTTAKTGKTIMRIRLTYNEIPKPWGVSSYGETEDYIINAKEMPNIPIFASNFENYNFGSIYLNNYKTVEYKIYNSTNIPTLTVHKPVITGNNANQFEIIDSNTYPMHITTDTLRFKVKFMPNSQGLKNASIEILTSNTREIKNFNLKGIGIENIPYDCIYKANIGQNLNARKFGSCISNSSKQFDSISPNLILNKVTFYGISFAKNKKSIKNADVTDRFKFCLYKNNSKNLPFSKPYFSTELTNIQVTKTLLKVGNSLNVYKYQASLPNVKTKEGWFSIQNLSNNNITFSFLDAYNNDDSSLLLYDNNFIKQPVDLAFYFSGSIVSPYNVKANIVKQQNKKCVALNWEYPNSSAKFNVYRLNKANNKWKLIAENIAKKSFTDFNINPLKYNYCVKAVVNLKNNLFFNSEHKNSNGFELINRIKK